MKQISPLQTIWIRWPKLSTPNQPQKILTLDILEVRNARIELGTEKRMLTQHTQFEWTANARRKCMKLTISWIKTRVKALRHVGVSILSF